MHPYAVTTTPTGRRATLTDRVAEEIRAVMGRRRVTGAQLARQLGVSQMWVSYRLRGTQPIDLNDLERIADALGVSVHNLIPGGSALPTRESVTPVPHAVDVRSPRGLRSRRRPTAVAA